MNEHNHPDPEYCNPRCPLWDGIAPGKTHPHRERRRIMSAHDTPEVGSGETAVEWQGCDFGCITHDCSVRCDAGSDPSEDVWNERTRHWYCPLGNDNCGAHTPASPDPVQPADAGEGEAEGEACVGLRAGCICRGCLGLPTGGWTDQ